MAIPVLIDALCVVGLYAASFMTAKAARHARGELREPSVVGQPRARLLGGIPNSVLGLAFYGLMIPAAWFLSVPAVYDAAFVACVVAAGVSVYLAYSLLFMTRMPCPFCWAGHVVNWSLLVLVIAAR